MKNVNYVHFDNKMSKKEANNYLEKITEESEAEKQKEALEKALKKLNISDRLLLTLVYGLKLSDKESRSLSNVSSLDPEFRPILCVWVDSVLESSPEVIVKHQRSYWKGGKNMVISAGEAAQSIA